MKNLARFSAIVLIVVTGPLNPLRPAHADTRGNTDAYEGTLDPNASNSPKSVAAYWWSGTTVSVTQRYGCTNLQGEPDPAPTPYCPFPYTAGWHQGIDIGLYLTTLHSRVEGTVAAAYYTTCLDPPPACPNLGSLAIQTPDGHIIYLLHGSPTYNYRNVGTVIHVGDPIYTTGGNGVYSSGYHLHFEVHNSLYGPGTLTCSSEPTGSTGSTCDDINPETWLTAVPKASGPQSTWGPGRLDWLAPNSGGYLRHDWFDNGWGVWQDIGVSPSISGVPVGVSWARNRYDVFAVGAGDTLHRGYATTYGFYPQNSPPRPSSSSAPPGTTWSDGLAVVSWAPNRLDGFARGSNGGIYHFYGDGTNWSIDDMGGHSFTPGLYPTPDLTVTSWGPNRLDLFARGCNQATCRLFRLSWSLSTQWLGWQDLGQTPGGALGPGLSAVAWDVGRLDVFATSSAGGVYHAYSNDPNPFNWDQFGNQPAPSNVSSGALAAISWGPSRLDLYIVGDNGSVYHIAWGGGPWLSWDSPYSTPVPPGAGAARGPINASAWGVDRLDVYVSGTSTHWYHEASGGNAYGWLAWDDLGVAT